MQTDTFKVIMKWSFLGYYKQRLINRPFIGSVVEYMYAPLMLKMAILTALLMLVSFNCACSNNHSYSETKLRMPLVDRTNSMLNIKKQMRVDHCQNRTWLVVSKAGECECADSLDGLIYCDTNTKEVFISSQYCMSYNTHQGEEVVGRCPYVYTSFYEQELAIPTTSRAKIHATHSQSASLGMNPAG